MGPHPPPRPLPHSYRLCLLSFFLSPLPLPFPFHPSFTSHDLFFFGFLFSIPFVYRIGPGYTLFISKNPLNSSSARSFTYSVHPPPFFLVYRSRSLVLVIHFPLASSPHCRNLLLLLTFSYFLSLLIA